MTTLASLSPASRALQAIRDRFDTIKDAIIVSKAVIVYGSAGIGKSWEVEQHVRSLNKELEFYKGKTTALGLYQKMYEYNRPNATIIVDDCDGMFNDRDALNLLKGALDTLPNRRVSWNTNTGILKTFDIPRQFDYIGQMVVISNRDFPREALHGSKQLREHFKAIISRATSVELFLNQQETFIRIEDVVKNNNMIETYVDDPKGRQEIWAFFAANFHQFRQPDLRTIYKMCQAYNNLPDRWQKVIANTECQNSENVKYV